MSNFDRRKFLLSSGAILGLPFLESLYFSRYTRAATDTPLRVILFNLEHGIYMSDGTRHRGKANEKDKGRFNVVPQACLDELNGVKDYVNNFQGLRLNAVTDGRTHPSCTYTLSTGFRSPEIANRKNIAQKNVNSWGEHALKAIGSGQFIDSMSLSAGRTGGVDYYKDGKAKRNYSNAREVFDVLFPNSLRNQISNQSNTTSSVDPLQKSILDYLTESIGSLKNRLSSSDKIILDRHLTSVRTVEKSINTEIVEIRGCNAPSAPSASGFEKTADSLVQLIPLAFACDSTRVINFTMGEEKSEEPFTFINGVTKKASFHEYSHVKKFADEFNIPYAQFANMHKLIDQYRFSLVGKIANSLKGIITASDGSNLLDNSLILMGGTIANGGNHTVDNIPALTIGKACNKLETGKTFKYEGNNYGVDFATLQRSLLNILGNSTQEFGHSGKGGIQASDIKA